MTAISLPTIPAKRYFTIGEVSELCQVKPHVLRYWEQEFSQLRPVKRRGNRRYYQLHEVLLIRRIRELLYEEGFTINGARHRLVESKSPSNGLSERLQNQNRPELSQAFSPFQAYTDTAGPRSPSTSVSSLSSRTGPGYVGFSSKSKEETLHAELKEVLAILQQTK